MSSKEESIEKESVDVVEIPKLNLLSSPSVQKLQNFLVKYQFLTVIMIILLIGLGIGGYFFYQSRRPLNSVLGTSTGQVVDKEATKKLVDEIGKIVRLPQGEDPTVAIVSDINKLKDQPFFVDAKTGDIVLMYAEARKVILYDPTDKKIVNLAPLTANATPSPNPQTQAKISLRNGTTVSGLASKVEVEIKKSFPLANIVSKDNTNKDNYTNTVVIVLNEAAKDAAANLAKTLNASIANLPSGENKPTGVDIVIIIGKDKI